MHRRTQSQRHQRLPEHPALPHNHRILQNNRDSADHQHNTELSVRRGYIGACVSVEHGTGKDEAGEDAELDRFVDAVPHAVDAEAHVEERGGEPGEPDEREEFEVVD